MEPHMNYRLRRRLSRRAVVRGSALAGLGAATYAFVGCGDDGGKSAGAGSGPAATPAAAPTDAPSPTATTSSPAPVVSTTPTTVVFRQAGTTPLSLDLFLAGAGMHPVVVFFHGAGNKTDQFWPQARAFAAQGYVTASVDYRAGTAPFPGPVADAKAAVRWLRAHAREYGIDPKRVTAVGGSMGGHLAAILAATPGIWEEGGDLDQDSSVRAVILLNPVLNYGDVGPSAAAFGNVYLGGGPEEAPSNHKAASAFTYVKASLPPTLLLHGTDDQTVPYAQAVAYHDALKTAGAVVELYTADGAGHGFFNNEPSYSRTLTTMQDFAKKYS